MTPQRQDNKQNTDLKVLMDDEALDQMSPKDVFRLLTGMMGELGGRLGNMEKRQFEQGTFLREVNVGKGLKMEQVDGVVNIDMDETDDPNRQGNSVTPAAGAGPVTPPGHDQYIDCVGVQPNIYLTHQFVQQHGTGITVMLDFNGVCYSPDATMLNQVDQTDEVYTNSTIMTDGCASSACGSGGGGGGPATLDRWRLCIHQHSSGDPVIPLVDDIYLSETVADTLGNFVNVNGDCYFLIASNEVGGVLTVPTTIVALADCADSTCGRCLCVRVIAPGDTSLRAEYTYDAEVDGWVHSLGLASGVIHYDDDEVVPRWEMQGTLAHHYVNAATNSNCPPFTGWTVADGVAPAPTIGECLPASISITVAGLATCPDWSYSDTNGVKVLLLNLDVGGPTPRYALCETNAWAFSGSPQSASGDRVRYSVNLSEDLTSIIAIVISVLEVGVDCNTGSFNASIYTNGGLAVYDTPRSSGLVLAGCGNQQGNQHGGHSGTVTVTDPR